ncbi:hypothetical protein Mal4_17840 [Maioricimonas rarisocia]|uniref:Uncharacterized protein n=1 Tax=Maioricimonas rarisocia TaxID=2528026 RepID=A0A517Z4Q9_9PLAN|nr:hypothetical protein [Maioricimonas rarisocia]QDU37470.1 hypothetical protein Mal4_17840 [Maioricimonas rarisocia]
MKRFIQSAVPVVPFVLAASALLASVTFGQGSGNETVNGSRCLERALCGFCIAGVTDRMRERAPNGTFDPDGDFGYYCTVSQSGNDRVIKACIVHENTANDTCVAEPLDPPVVLDNCHPPKLWYCEFIPEEDFENECDVTDCECEGPADETATEAPTQTHTCSD